MSKNKAIIFSAPSGSGKSTIIGELLKRFENLEFSISATSRRPRGEEKDGVDYYFLSIEEFKKRVDNDEFLEWEEVYEGTCYGTLKSEFERIGNKGNISVFDVDVVGGVNIKKFLKEKSISIFVMPPSIEVLKKRLISRATDSEKEITKRIAKAEQEISYYDQFDEIVINDELSVAVVKAEEVINNFISK